MLKCSLKEFFIVIFTGCLQIYTKISETRLILQILLLLVCKGVYLPCKLKLGMLLQSMRSVVTYYGRHFKNKQLL